MLTHDEVMREGLAGRRKRPQFQVVESAETGRGVVTAQKVSKKDYVCEYKTTAVYGPDELKEYERIHDLNSAGSYTVETAYPVPGAGGRLMFDATERFHHAGRYINHVPRGGNLKLMGPYYIRGKWRVGFIAIRDIEEGEELCYDYGEQSEEWMRRGRLVDGKVTSGLAVHNVPEGEEVGGRVCMKKGLVDGEESVVLGPGEDKETPGAGKVVKPAKARKPGKRRHYWCPIQGCPSGPVMKMTQHLANVHKLTRATARRVATKK